MALTVPGNLKGGGVKPKTQKSVVSKHIFIYKAISERKGRNSKRCTFSESSVQDLLKN